MTMVIDRVDVGVGTDGAPATVPAVSVGARMRLDLHSHYDTKGQLVWEAIVTPRFSAPSAYKVSDVGSSVVLDAFDTAAVGSLGNAADRRIDLWQTFTIQGQLGGSLKAFATDGMETDARGAQDSFHPLHAFGHFEADVEAPEIHAPVTPESSRAGERLPWDEIFVELSEPIDLVDLRSALGTELPSPTEAPTPVVPWSFSPNGGGANGWAGAVGVWTLLRSWSTNGDLRVGTFEDVQDPSGNILRPTSKALGVLPVPPPQASHLFDNRTITVASWGLAEFLGADGVDPRCEHGGCVKLGPDPTLVYCGTATNRDTGIAGRILVGAGHTLHVRYRALTSSNTPSNSDQPGFGPDILVVLLAAPGIRLQGPALPPASAGFGKVDVSTLQPYVGGPGEEALHYATPWLDYNASFTVPTAEIGFELDTGIAKGFTPCGPSPPHPLLTAFIVDSVEVK